MKRINNERMEMWVGKLSKWFALGFLLEQTYGNSSGGGLVLLELIVGEFASLSYV